mgnify:FL=1
MPSPRTPLPRLAVLALAALLCLPAAAQESVRETHGDWTVLCNDTQPDACVMQQTGQGNEGNDLLDVRVRKLEGVTTEEGERVPAAIQIAAPLGVLLRGGVRVRVDGNEERGAPFEICVQNGCIVRDLMSEAFLEEMKRGITARMTIVSPREGEVTSDISLDGFTAAFNALHAAQGRR